MKYVSTLLIILFCNVVEAKSNYLPKSFKASFVQTIESSLSGHIKQSFGEISYRFPSELRIDINKPDKTTYVANAEKSWYYQAPFLPGEKGEVSISRAEKNILLNFFEVLNNGLVTNKHYSVEQNKKKRFVLKFSAETAKKLKIKEASLGFTNPNQPVIGNLNLIILIYPDNRKVGLTFSNLKTEIEFKKKNFQFEVPPNTNVVKN